jgi:hypothetical protein
MLSIGPRAEDQGTAEFRRVDATIDARPMHDVREFRPVDAAYRAPGRQGICVVHRPDPERAAVRIAGRSPGSVARGRGPAP